MEFFHFAKITCTLCGEELDYNEFQVHIVEHARCCTCNNLHGETCVVCCGQHCHSTCPAVNDVAADEWSCSTCHQVHNTNCFLCNALHCPTTCNITNTFFQDLSQELEHGQRKRLHEQEDEESSQAKKARLLHLYSDLSCVACNLKFQTGALLDFHMETTHNTDSELSLSQIQPLQYGGELRLKLENDAWGLYQSHSVDLRGTIHKEVGPLLNELKAEMLSLIHKQIHTLKCLKWFVKINVHFYKAKVEDGELVRYAATNPDPAFYSSTHMLTKASSFDQIIEATILQLDESIANFLNNGSGWIVDRISNLSIDIARFNPFNGGSYIPLKGLLVHKIKSLLNIDNSHENDGKCFLWSVLAHESISHLQERYGKNQNRYDKKVRTYNKPEILNQVNCDGIDFPMSEKQIAKFERNNPNLSINVFGYEETHKSDKFLIEYNKTKDYYILQKGIRDCVFPLYVTNKPPNENMIEIDLLQVIENMPDGSFKAHFCLIRSLSGFLGKGNNEGNHICRNCLQNFLTPQGLTTHRKFCVALGLQKVNFPEDSHYTFRKFERMVKVPFRYYADFESILKKIQHLSVGEQRQILQKHIACGYTWICIDWTGEVVSESTYRASDPNEDVVARFMEELIQDTEIRSVQIMLIQQERHKSMKMTRRLKKKIKGKIRQDKTKLDPCYFCKKRYVPSDKVVFHHCHFTGEFLGLAHDDCNKIGRMGFYLPVFMHNLKSYDSHFIIKSCTAPSVKNIDVIPSSSEKFSSLTINNRIRFLDSYQFNSTSLSNLVNTLSKNGTDDFKITKAAFEGKGDVNLLFRKGAYPYSYMDSLERFKETRLPAIEHFYNDLADEQMDTETYNHAKKVWNSFKIKNLGEWHDLYVRLDVCLLADCMEKTRNLLWESYNLDLCHYFSLPMVSFDAVCMMGGVNYEYIKDPHMLAWLESAVRGGYCGVGGIRAAEANNKYMGPRYKPNRETSFIQYLDMNNLYGAAMLSYLPEKDFEWVEGEELEAIKENPRQLLSILTETSDKGYFFEVDLSVPNDRHHFLNDFPPAPIKRPITTEEMSPYQLQQAADLDIANSCFKTTKLVADLHPKKNYVTHYRNLQIYVKLGLKIDKVHCVLKFSQRPWMMPYIKFNTDKRTAATSDYEKDFYKLLNNSAFGKCCEQKRKRKSMVIVRKEEDLRKYLNKPTYERIITIDQEKKIFLVVKKNLSVYMDRPISVGASVLEISKCFMYNFHYDYMTSKYGSRARVVYSDTDSLVYHIVGDQDFDFYKDMKENSHLFDMSDFKGLFAEFHDPTNKKVVGKMKDEFPTSVITNFAAAKPKMYAVRAITFVDGQIKILDKCKGKGIPRASLKQIQFDDYVHVLEANRQTEVYINTIRSHLHNVTTERLVKKALNGFDTKRLIVDAVTTLAHGHVDTHLYF